MIASDVSDLSLSITVGLKTYPLSPRALITSLVCECRRLLVPVLTSRHHTPWSMLLIQATYYY